LWAEGILICDHDSILAYNNIKHTVGTRHFCAHFELQCLITELGVLDERISDRLQV
jgi:hypothetical protein